jgi:hypothetical protein
MLLYCRVAAAPIRSMPKDSAEMVHQWLLGESAELLKEEGLWLNIKKQRDGYEGWVNKNESSFGMPLDLDAEHDFQIKAKPSPYHHFLARNKANPNDIARVLPGSPILLHAEKAEIHYPFGSFELIGQLKPLNTLTPLSTAMSFLGTPYLWGGISEFGIDCSGLIQSVGLLHGLDLPRNSYQQFEALEGVSVTQVSELKEGDIVFFNPKGGRISHVGFYLGRGYLLHASGYVRIDALTKEAATQGLNLNERYATSICGKASMMHHLQHPN